MNTCALPCTAVVGIWSQPQKKTVLKFHTRGDGHTIYELIRAIRANGLPDTLEECFEMARSCRFGDDSLLVIDSERVAFLEDGQMKVESDDEASQWRFFRQDFELPRADPYRTLMRDVVIGYHMHFEIV